MKCLHTSVKPLHTIFADCPKSRNFAIPNPQDIKLLRGFLFTL